MLHLLALLPLDSLAVRRKRGGQFGAFQSKKEGFPLLGRYDLWATSGQFSSDRNSIGSLSPPTAVVVIVAPHKQALWAVSTSTAKEGGDDRGEKAFFKMPITRWPIGAARWSKRRVRSIIAARGRNQIANLSQSAAPHFHFSFPRSPKSNFCFIFMPPPPCPLRLFLGRRSEFVLRGRGGKRAALLIV